MKSKWILMTALAAALSAAVPGVAQTPPAKTAAVKPASETGAPSDKDIADAKSKGMVWVNTSTKVYHKDGQFYGKTKKGKFMTEGDATKAGFKAAKEPVAKATPSTKK
jgi:hypothetical protein